MRKTIYILSFCIFLTITFILIIEVLLRWYQPMFFCNTVSKFQYDQEVGVITKNDLNFSILTDHIIEVKTNNVGSNNYQNKEDFLNYKRLIFCVGDSFTEGVGSLTDENYPFYLDLLLNYSNGQYNKEYGIVNLGLGGYGSLQSYLILERYTKIFGRIPSTIIYMACSNDSVDDAEFKSGRRHHHIVQNSPYYSKWIIFLNEWLEYSQIYFRLKTVRGLLTKKYIDENSNYSYPPKQEIFEGIPKIVQFAKNHKSQLILSYTDYNNSYFDYLKEYSAKNDFDFCDYRNHLLQFKNNFNKLPILHSHSGGHFRSWVNYIIAADLSNIIKKSLLQSE